MSNGNKVGAGISTAAGIPDFRSPETGLYSSLARLELPRPEAVFDIAYFREDPRPFYSLAQELWPGRFKPTLTHLFMRMFADRGLLLRVFTQNIDALELAAGLPRDQVVFAHGNFMSQHCIDCFADYDRAKLEAHVRRAQPAFCEACGGLVKPDITFFGEALPHEFYGSAALVQQADLAIVLGSSLSVFPFAALPMRVDELAPRVLINMEMVGEIGSRRDDVVWLGECDDGVRALAERLGWWDELEGLWKSFRGGDRLLAESPPSAAASSPSSSLPSSLPSSPPSSSPLPSSFPPPFPSSSPSSSPLVSSRPPFSSSLPRRSPSSSTSSSAAAAAASSSLVAGLAAAAEALEAEVNRLTGEVDKSLRLAEEHRERVSRGLQRAEPQPTPGLAHVFPHLHQSGADK